MIRDGNAAVTETVVRDFYGGRDRWIRGTDDILILPRLSERDAHGSAPPAPGN